MLTSPDPRFNTRIRNGVGSMKFKQNFPFATPETAEQKLLELAYAIGAEHGGRVPVGEINTQFRNAGGTSAEYRAAVAAAIAHGWLTLHPSAGYLSFTPLGFARVTMS
jgi:hypothetical protein